MPIPALAAVAIPAIGQLLSSYFGGKQQKEMSEEELALQRQQLAQQASAQKQDTALEESKLDPFRHSMFQASDLSALDKLERASYTPTTMQLPARYAQYAPKISGGYSYTKSPELTNAAAALKTQVLSGQGAPTMTNPSNYGKTGALDLLAIAAGKATPGTPGALATTPNVDPVELRRRARWYKQDNEQDPEAALAGVSRY